MGPGVRGGETETEAGTWWDVPGPPVSVLGFLWSLAPDGSACILTYVIRAGSNMAQKEARKKEETTDNKVFSSWTSSKAGLLT